MNKRKETKVNGMTRIWMTRTIGIVGLLVAFLLSVGIADAHKYNRGKVYFNKADIKLDGNSKITPASGSTGTLAKAHLSDRTRYYELNLAEFTLSADGVVLSAATVPGQVLANLTPALEWAQSETAKAQTHFRVPADYVSGAAFICMVSLDAASTDTTVDFNIYVNRSGLAYDAATTNQTPVAVANDTTKNNDITLTVATDTFQAADMVTFEVWRAAGTGAGSNLNLIGCYLSYTADM